MKPKYRIVPHRSLFCDHTYYLVQRKCRWFWKNLTEYYSSNEAIASVKTMMMIDKFNEECCDE